MDQIYINNYIKFIWIIISSSTNKNSNLSTTSLLKLFNQFNSKYGEFLNNLIINSQVSKINLVISTYYLYKYYHSNHVLNHDLSEDTTNQQQQTGEISNIHIYNVIMSLILSNKSFDDQSYTLKTWLIIIQNTLKQQQYKQSTIVIDLKLINIIESYFLSCLNYNLSYIKMYNDLKFWNLIEFNKVFLFNFETIYKFKNQVSLKEIEEDVVPVTTTLSTSPIIKIASTSPLISTFSSPLNYPLTPRTPIDFVTSNSSSSSCRKRKNVPMLPSQLESNFKRHNYQNSLVFQNSTPVTLPSSNSFYQSEPFKYYNTQTYQVPQQLPQQTYYYPSQTYTTTQYTLPLQQSINQYQSTYQSSYQNQQPQYNQTLINPFNTQQQYNSYW
ncbi:hypothetical protein KGF54_001722 [Candida jiufengensis]|uniref:uncharacterized protein n=1 Tax=Candida jiufengensis TaxID=497108 RepID=UPI002225914B|nr:uncharacterized protein KGF54_001722 [Candida jiufengensis]KAI5955161.1 hypothetical protein KGF54_001722 [Candida jiufengensis]